MKKVITLTIAGGLLALVFTAGCASMGKKPKPEELVMQQVRSLVDDLFAGKVENLLGYVSEDFFHPDVATKAKLAEYLDQGKQMGYTDNLPQLIKDHEGKVVLDKAVVTVQGDAAKVYPIEANAVEGSVTVELDYKKDKDGVWRISGAQVEGI
jgi:hypothetical protein